MDPNILNALVGLGGVVTGALVTFISLRKMPSEIGNTQSTTLNNLINSNKLLSTRLQEQQTEIDELRGWLSGSIEIRTRVLLTNPPRILTADIRRIEESELDPA